MDQEDIRLPKPSARMDFTGERYVSGLPGNIGNEHYHRYLFALRLCRGKDVLDVASGEGYGSALLASVARSVVGVDIDEASVSFATNAYARANLTYRAGSVLALPVADASVDVVVCYETLEHVSEHETLLDEVARVLRPDGMFIVSTPDRRVYSEEADYQNPYHLKELSREEFEAVLRQRFSHVRLYEQQVLEGSVLASASSDAVGVESFSTADGSLFRHRQGLPHAPYLVAVASPHAVEMPAASLLSGLQTDATLAHDERDQLRILLTQERQRIAELELQLTEQGVRLGQARLDHERGYLRAMVTAARERQNLMSAEYAAAHGALAEQLKATEAQLAAREADFAARIEAIRTSTSWRLTGPMRVLVRSIRKILR